MNEKNVTNASTESSKLKGPAMAAAGAANKKLIIVLCTVIGVLGISVVALAVSLFSKDDGEKETYSDGRATFVTPENVEEVKEDLSKPIEDAYYTTSMTVDWTFHDGESVSTSAYVGNSTANKRTVYFDVHLRETGELIYSSPYLPVGEKMYEIKLDKALEKGDYAAIVTYHLVDDDHKELTTVSVAITIHVLN